jgi:hypothetical protein
MKNHILTIITIMTAIVCGSPILLAQMSPQYGDITQGMFGYRAIGRPPAGMQMMGAFGYRSIAQPLAYPSSNFSSVIPLGPSRSYTFLTSPLDYYAAPQYQFAVPELNNAAELAAQQGAAGLAPAQPAPTAPAAAQPAATPPAEAIKVETTSATGQTLGVTITPQSAAPPAAANQIMPRIRTRMSSASPNVKLPFARSTAMSDRMTMIARNKDMLVGRGIEVYLSNNVAQLKGTVRTPADRILLGNVLSLQPGVSYIDNQLVAENFSPPSNLRGR